MTDQQKTSKTINTILWIAQAILAVTLIWAAMMKLFQPIDKLSQMWPWVAQVPAAVVKLTGLVDLTGAFGLILPAMLRIKPKLTPIAALCIIVLMICAIIFHISRGEAPGTWINFVFAALAAFIAWGRFKKVVVLAK